MDSLGIGDDLVELLAPLSTLDVTQNKLLANVKVKLYSELVSSYLLLDMYRRARM